MTNTSCESIEKIVVQMKRRLAAFYKSCPSGPAQSIDVLSISRRPYSVVVYLAADLGEKLEMLVGKIVVENPLNASIVERSTGAFGEYELLKSIYEKFGHIDGCGVPRPVLGMPELRSSVTAYVDGPMLSEEMKYVKCLSSPSGFAGLARRFYLCGRWVRCFQGFTGGEEAGAEVFGEIIERCRHRLALIEGARDPRWPRDLGKRVMDTLWDCTAHLGGQKVIVAGRHGDFHPYNIIADREGITVIDFFGYKKEPLIIDVLKMLVFLDDEAESLSTSSRRLMELRNQFLNGYGDVEEVSDDILIIGETQQRVLSVANCIVRRRKRWQDRIGENRIVKRHLEWLSEGKWEKVNTSAIRLGRNGR